MENDSDNNHISNEYKSFESDNQEPKVIRTQKQDHIRTMLVATLSALFAIILIFGLFYAFRTNIFSSIAGDYFAQNIESTDNTGKDPTLFSGDNLVIGAVKKANPAVVAITISKDVPKYETFFQTPQTDPFGLFFNVPQQRQNGTENKEVGNGSGFLVSEDGYIVTNRHVVEDKNAQYTVTINDGQKKIAKIIAVDDVYDIAIIKIEGNNYPILSLGDSSSLELGATVIAIGNALGQFKNTVSVGVVSGLSRSITAGDGIGKSEQLEQVIQTDAAINPGNSGGPLLNLLGEAIGINVAVAQDSQSIGFALPINSVKGVISSVRETGKISRPYIGIRYLKITTSLKEKEKLPIDYGVLIKSTEEGNPAILKGSPAEKAGLKAGDIVTEIDGKKLDENQSLSLIIRGHKIGDTVVLKILRNGDEQYISAVLQEAPEL